MMKPLINTFQSKSILMLIIVGLSLISSPIFAAGANSQYIECKKGYRPTGCSSPYLSCKMGRSLSPTQNCSLSMKLNECEDFSWENCCFANCAAIGANPLKDLNSDCFKKCLDSTPFAEDPS